MALLLELRGDARRFGDEHGLLGSLNVRWSLCQRSGPEISRMALFSGK